MEQDNNPKMEDWFIKFVNKKQPFESEDVNMILRLIGCYYFIEGMDKHLYPGIEEEVTKCQKEFYHLIEPYLIITPRN